MKTTRALFLFLLSIPFVAGFAENVQITVHSAMQGFNLMDPPGIDHPVLTSVSHNAKQLVSELTVTNYSSKPVAEVTYGWRIAGAAKCVGHSFPAKWGSVKQVLAIASGGTATLAPPQMLTSNTYLHQIIDEADLANAHVVIVTVGIVKVTYSDGTTWEDKDAGPKMTFDGGIAEIVATCSAASAPNANAKQAPHCQDVSLRDGVFKRTGSAQDQCWPTPAQACTGRVIISGDCPFQDCVIVGCGFGCYQTWTVCSASFWPLNCRPIGN